jgi:hypothetical protein
VALLECLGVVRAAANLVSQSWRSLTIGVVLSCWPSAMPQKIRNMLLALVVIFALAMLTVLFFSVGRTPPLSPLPNPNGYDDFLKAVAVLTGDVGNMSTLDHDGLRALVSTNSESLRLLRLGLTRQGATPIDSKLTNETLMIKLLNQLVEMKRLAPLLAAEGRLREMDNRLADAAQSYVDAIHFGNEMGRGGLLLNLDEGIECEEIGCHALAKVVPTLSRGDARIVLLQLEKVDEGRVKWAEVLRSHRYYSRYQNAGHFNPLRLAIDWSLSRNGEEYAKRKHKIITAHERLLAAELALRCYQSEQGRVPTRLADLVTNCLSKVPLDPFSGGPMIYRPQGTNWLLYSVGEDGVDDGGIPVRGWPVKGDILFDSPF